MVSLLAIFEATLEEVTDLLNASADSLGLGLVRPLEPGEHSWECYNLDGASVFASTRKPYNIPGCENSVWVELYDPGTRFDQLADVFANFLTLSLKPTEVVVVDDCGEATGPLLTYSGTNADVTTILDDLEYSYTGCGLHSLRAFSRAILPSLGDWSAAVDDRGLEWKEASSFFVLDLSWAHCGRPIGETNPLTGLPTAGEWHRQLFLAMEASPSGTAFIIKITEVIPNANRAYETWLLALPVVSAALQKAVSCRLACAPTPTPQNLSKI